MTCIYCRVQARAESLTAEPVVPRALGGQLLLRRAACPDCSRRIRELTDDFLSSQFRPTVQARAHSGPRSRLRDPGALDARERVASAPDWRHAHRAVAKILYCYVMLELGEAVLVSRPSDILRRYVVDGEVGPCVPECEVTRATLSPSPSIHVLSFDSMSPTASIGLFGTLWFRFRLDLEALTPHGRLLALDAIRGESVMTVVRRPGGWSHRRSARWGWKR